MDNIIIPNIKGGLGNQMFQIAAAMGHATKHGAQAAINYTYDKSCRKGNESSRYRDKFYSKIKVTEENPLYVYIEPHFHFSDIPYSGSTIIDGYFQSKKYFESCTDLIKDLFSFTDVDRQGWQRLRDNSAADMENPLGVHIRRGDYLLYPSIHPIQSDEYYKEAFNYFLNGSVKPSSVIVCSDDWNTLNRDNLINKIFNKKGIPVYITKGCSELQDLYILSQCKNIIMSNSSFSWWGEFLGVEKKTVAPKYWFGCDGPQDYYDIYNFNWKLI